MSSSRMASYLRSHRLKSGLSQRELAELVGTLCHQQVSQHERTTTIPSLIAAVAYQYVFGVSLTEIFPGLAESVRLNVEERLHIMKEKLEDSTAKGREAQKVARTLEWLWERENPDAIDLAA